jgi:hypothetical protein
MTKTSHARQIGAAMLVVLAATAFAREEPAGRPAAPPPELLQKPYLYEVMRHLYRWYLDEGDLDAGIRRKEFVFGVRALDVPLDPGDRSRFGEITLPELGITVRVKKADYTIPELDTVVRNDTFKIVDVRRGPMAADPPADATEVRVDYPEVRDYCFRTRNQLEFPDDELLMRMRLAAREELLEELRDSGEEIPAGEQVLHLSSLSPVANEVWVFWETGRRLLRFASDIDLAEPAVWEHEELAVRIYNLDEQVVVSLDEVPGSNAYLTRDQVGRALCNCILLGKRLVIEPLPTAPPATRPADPPPGA